MTEELDRNIAPKINQISNLKKLELEEFKLSNGAPVYVFNNPHQELLKVELVFDAGSAVSEKPLVAGAVNNMLTEVTKNYSAKQLAEEIDFYGAYFETSATRDNASVVLYSLDKFIDNTIPILAEVIKNASFNEKEFEQYKTRKIQEFHVNNEKVSFIARQQFTSLLFGENHPYGSFATVEDYDNLKREDLIEFHKENYLKGGFKVFISGKFGDDEFNVLNNYLGKLSTSKKVDIDERNWSLQPSNEFKHHIKKNNAVQNAIRMGFVGVDRDHKDYFGIKILSTILGGYFGSRLMTNIREDKGYTYGIGSSFSSLRKESIFFIATELKSEVVDLAIEEIGKEIRILQNELISDEELFTVKNYMQGSIQRSFDGSLAMLDRFKEINLNNLDMNYYHNYVDVIKTIDADNIKVLAQKYLDMDRMYILNVGN